ncbi:uncharacterized protein [Branchiostoma lanceolatum]|uniref:uncharacterized protein n=1 Tax=Branchiostoma lanceolatum TaxID=7740 RepID=UPI0034537F49
MLYLILLITAVCSTAVHGTAQGGNQQHRTWRALDLCKIREGCRGIALTKPSPDDDVSSMKDLCRAAGDKLNSLDPDICESLLSPEAEDQHDSEKPHPGDVDGQLQLPQTYLASLVLSGRTNYFSDCSEIHTALSLFNAVSSGVYDIMPVGLDSPISVYCDQTTDGGARVDGHRGGLTGRSTLTDLITTLGTGLGQPMGSSGWGWRICTV